MTDDKTPVPLTRIPSDILNDIEDRMAALGAVAQKWNAGLAWADEVYAAKRVRLAYKEHEILTHIKELKFHVERAIAHGLLHQLRPKPDRIRERIEQVLPIVEKLKGQQ